MEPSNALDDILSELDFGFGWSSGLASRDDHENEAEFEELFRELEEAGDSQDPLRPDDDVSDQGPDTATDDIDQSSDNGVKSESKLDKIKGLGSFAEKLGEELSILVFFQNKCLIKSMKYSNYLRLERISTLSERLSNLKKKLKVPYMRAEVDCGYLAVPSARHLNAVPLPYLHEDLEDEWKPSDLKLLEMCVCSGYYRQQHFFMESRFQQMLFDMGFTSQDLNQIHVVQRSMDEILWFIIKTNRLAEASKKDKYFNILQKYLEKELKVIQDLMAEHEKNKAPIVPYVVRRTNSTKLVIDLKDIVAWKQHETRLLYSRRFNPVGKLECISMSEVDWLFVEKEMAALTDRTETSDDFRKAYHVLKSDRYNHTPMSTREFNDLRRAIRDDKSPSGLNWIDIAEKLGTNRTPIQLFQTYKSFISTEEDNEFLKTEEGRLTTFRVVRENLGHIPRVVQRLSNQFGDIDIAKFEKTWESINPKLAVGNFVPVEDAALFVAMEFHREEIMSSKTFSGIETQLPWRHTVTWRKRASFLFHNFDKWTIDEDKLLLYVAKKYGLNWPGLPKVFHRRSKLSCLFRYDLLKEKLPNVNLKQYHALYERRDNRSNIGNLREAAGIIRQIIETYKEPRENVPTCNYAMIDVMDHVFDDKDSEGEGEEDSMATFSNQLAPTSSISQDEVSCSVNLDSSNKEREREFILDTVTDKSIQLTNEDQDESKELTDEITETDVWLPKKHKHQLTDALNAWKTPGPDDIKEYLKTFDKNILEQTLERLNAFIDLKASEFESKKVSGVALCWDKRKFCPDDPVSVASALILRRVPLKPITREMWATFNEFEKGVCRAYQIFERGSRTKKSVIRKTIPTEMELSFLPSLRNLLLKPIKLASEPSKRMSVASPLPRNLSVKSDIAVGTPIIQFTSNATSAYELKPQADVQLVAPTATVVEAINRLSRRVWNNSTQQGSEKVKTVSKKRRRKALNTAAAQARWSKQAKISTTEGEEESSTKIKSQNKAWYDHVLRKSGIDGTAAEKDNGEEKIVWESNNVETGEPPLLNVLHDHSYAPDHGSWVKNVIHGAQQTLGGAGTDSSKENEGDENG